MPLRYLESESTHILREAAAECRAPVFLYSIGKDSSLLLRLMQKAFHPAPVPSPLLHIDTGWRFRAMIAHWDRTARELGLRLVVHTKEAVRQAGINPFDYPHYTRAMKTEALRAALDAGGWDAAIAGARRDEEHSRAKERVFSLRAPGHAWDPKRQRAEFWRVWNTRLSPGKPCGSSRSPIGPRPTCGPTWSRKRSRSSRSTSRPSALSWTATARW